MGSRLPRGNTAGRSIETELPSVASYSPFKWHILPTYTEKHRMEKIVKNENELPSNYNCMCMSGGRQG